MSTGPDADSLERYASGFAGGTVHLCSGELGFTDGSGDISTVSEASTGTSSSDWNTSVDGGAEEVVLTNTEELNFGEPSGFTVQAMILEHPSEDEYVQKSVSGDTDLSGDGETFIDPDSATFTISR